MRRILRVARNEYLNHVRTKAFVVSVVLMPVLMGGAIALQALLEDHVDTSDRRFAVIDRTGALFGLLEKAAAERKELPRFVPERAPDDLVALSVRIRSQELLAALVLPEGVLEGSAPAAYHTLTPTYRDLPHWIHAWLWEEARRVRYERAGIDRALVERLNAPVALEELGLVERSASGAVKGAERLHEGAAAGVAGAALMLLFMIVMSSAPILLNNILEEKMQRIAEVLVSSVSPFELFGGKLLGAVLIALTLSLLYAGGAVVVAHRYGLGALIPARIYLWFFVFEVLALLIYGSIYSALGAACSELRDAQSMMLPAVLLALLPLLVWPQVMREPTSDFARWISLFPPATPFLMLLRIALPPGPAAWEVALGAILSAGFTALCVLAAGKIFRVGILAQGQPPSYRRLLSWLRSK